MISNRQNGRRRGRGGPRPQGMDRPNGGGNNRPETRSRGNAPQLHEKYKSMARDAQLAGDRVQTEYYLQFADHYYRILNENRPRFDEQRPQQGRDEAGRDDGASYSADDYDDEDGGEDENSQSADDGDEAPARQQLRTNGYDRDARPQRDRSREDRPQRDAQASREDRPQRDAQVSRDDRSQRESQPQRDGQPQREGQPQRFDRDDRPQRQDRPQRTRNDASGERPPRDVQPERDVQPDRETQPERTERPRRVRTAASNGAERPAVSVRDDDAPGIDLDRLPPAIARPDQEASAPSGEDDRPRPVRRPRRPREETPEAA